MKGELANKRGGQRLQRQRDAELLHHVGFGFEVEVGLHGTGAQHHVEAELALLGHVLAHDLVAALGHPVHVLALPFRREAEADEAGADLARDLLDLVEVLFVLLGRLVQGLERRTREFELAARLERDAGVVALQRDRVVAFGDRLPAEARHAFQHGADAVRPVIGQAASASPCGSRTSRARCPCASRARGLLPAAKYSISCRRFSIGVPPPDGGADIRPRLPRSLAALLAGSGAVA